MKTQKIHQNCENLKDEIFDDFWDTKKVFFFHPPQSPRRASNGIQTQVKHKIYQSV